MLLPSHRGDRYETRDTDGDDMKWKDMDPEEKIKIKNKKLDGEQCGSCT